MVQGCQLALVTFSMLSTNSELFGSGRKKAIHKSNECERLRYSSLLLHHTNNEFTLVNIPTTGVARRTGSEALSSSTAGGPMSDLNTYKIFLVVYQT